jgi:hypothetical protein
MAAPVGTFLFGGLIAWGVYRRIRRNIGRQPLRSGRLIFSLSVFVIVTLLLLGLSLLANQMLLGIGGGLVLGASLGVLGLRLTRFETTTEGHFYTPNTSIGVALSLLFLGRILYRIWITRDAMAGHVQPQLFQSPLTFFIFGLLAGYYIVYYGGLIQHARSKA